MNLCSFYRFAKPRSGIHSLQEAGMRAGLGLGLALLVGCAGAATTPYPLEGTLWQVESIDRGGIVDRSIATLDFREAGRLAGSGSCNRYFGGVTREGSELTIGGVGSTLMACVEALMSQERRFFAALEATRRYEVQSDNRLLLLDESGDERIRALRLEVAPEAPAQLSSRVGMPSAEPRDLASDTLYSFYCDGAGTVVFRFLGPDTIALTVESGPDTWDESGADTGVGSEATEHVLTLQRAASGARYAGDGIEFWNKGDEAMLTAGAATHTCNAKPS